MRCEYVTLTLVPVSVRTKDFHVQTQLLQHGLVLIWEQTFKTQNQTVVLDPTTLLTRTILQTRWKDAKTCVDGLGDPFQDHEGGEVII